ncbi:MAG: protein-L-isoaspartate(D-aspartate) O-methyltransferase [Hymenobacteraceae bacterium]|nr:protein-L-isoaspartate(D-aspartate) O-methyltransferase [Hymenobacteraceae bacterium]MDX5394914.1 protein-L-isoaspartate(D-aspartate) O-methyltransferase [Hymenobacteraceae bacterium]MDX5442612.1 protein-L-isoaspartate(D-aspartate) O-methyltransferase [Hymenobacteraceae bacterium]MDX5510949.1 protein-L-isoaspartate(D-aspartate) O-methyltransferase [Hymenobacteraceae bacterium]
MYLDTYKHKGMRNALVKQLREKGVTDERVLSAIGAVPRHFFFEKAFIEHAYQDKAFPIGEGQTISQPYTVAYQTELLQVETNSKVLEIGTGSGYQCCVLLQITPNVYTIEYNRNLYLKASRFFAAMNLHPKHFCGDGSQGLPQYAPFDRILVTAGAPATPRSLLEQLTIGGILVIPVGDSKSQKMLRITRVEENEFTKEEFDNFKFVPLLGKSGWK